MSRLFHGRQNQLAGALACVLVVAAAMPLLAEESTTVQVSPAKSSELLESQRLTPEVPVTYRVEQIVTLSEIPKGSKLVRIWASIPADEAQQKLLDFQVKSSPGKWKIVEDADHRGKFLQVDVLEPATSDLNFEVAFSIRRDPVYVALDAGKAGPLTDGMKSMLAEHLDLDAPHMEVTDILQKMADDICGKEQNIAVQATLLLKHVASTVDHYSYSLNPDMPSCGIGDAGLCLAQGGGCCTDLNSLFISLARARGIPARLNMGYRLQEKNLGKLVDPGYRCWVEYYVPNYGWISTDIVEADTPGGLGPQRWFTGLTARRIWLNQGREFKLAGAQVAERVNHMSIAYAEIDGKPARLLPAGKLKPQITRKVLFTELESGEAKAGVFALPVGASGK
jgi:transglutaminase-like putative cysteine protease